MKNKILILFILIFSAFQSFAQKAVNVSAKIEVLMEGNYSKEFIKEKAIQAAKIKAMGDEFGYAIVQGINTQMKTTGSNTAVLTTNSMSEVSNTIVQGEWIKDSEGYPRTRFEVRDKEDDQEIWLHCEVKGKARKIEAAKVDFEAFTFNCNEPQKCNTVSFKHEDSMYLYFKSPVKGYLSVFMQEEGFVYRLLPYAQMKDKYESNVSVAADKEYLLFSPAHRDYFEGFPLVDEYGMETGEDGEPLSNILYVVFSKTEFNKPVMAEDNGLKFLKLDKFQEWVNKNKGLNKEFQVSRINIVVNK